MNISEKRQIKSYIIDYLSKKVLNFTIKGKMFTCPKCDKISANIFPTNSNKVWCYSPDCGNLGDIFQIARMIDFDGNEDVDDESIAKFLKKEFKIQTNDDVDKLLQKYINWGWDLMPIVKNEKIPYQGKDWQNKSCKDLKIWQDWINSELNIASRCGEKSNNLIIDIDFLTAKEADIIAEGKDKVKIKEVLAKKEKNQQVFDEKYKQFFNATVTQDTKNKGIHYIYLYDKDLPKTSFDLDGIHFDIETDGGYCLVAPSMINGKIREIVGDTILEMSKELKELLLNNCSNKKIEKKMIKKSKIIVPNENELSFENLNGNRNNTFNHLMGILRKRYPIKEVEYIIGLFNKLIDKQVPSRELKAMLQQIAKYDNLDTSELVNKIWDYLQKHKEATARDLESYFKADSKEIKDILVQLMEENKIFRQRGSYKAIKKADWKDTIIDFVKVIPYKMPYFDDYNTFRDGDMICIGARPGIGKTHVAMNIIKKLIQQGIKPNYLGSESRSRFLKIAMEIGIKEGEFNWDTSYEPERIELEDNAVTIIDWLLPEDFVATANVYKMFQKQLDRHGGNCFIFSQLMDNDKFYAENQLIMFASMALKYFYGQSNGSLDNTNTFFKSIKARESKVGKQYLDIPTKFENKLLELRR